MQLPARLYQQFDADPTRDVPGEAYGGWKTREVTLAPEHTAVVVMHAWDCGAPHEYPGWRRAVEYDPRARAVLASVFPPLLAAVRQSPVRLYHVVGSRDYYSHLPGFRRAKQLTGPEPAPAQVTADPCYLQLRALREKEIFPGVHNQPDIRAGFQRLDFAPEARPVGNEGIAETGSQLAALCRADDINHLVYIGFAINWCLLMSPGGMVDLGRHGLICSVLEDAVTAVENRETAREQREKAQALWRVSLEWGFVFNSVDFMRALTPTVPATQPSSP